MSGREPILSIGLPVYNGEHYLESTLESIVAQTFTDFELIISDNASTDATPEICRAIAARDRRICYFRNPVNLGAAKNYNRVFELSRGKYFKWNGHDDPLPPDFLELCVATLERDDTVVLAFGRACAIDEHGQPTRTGPLVAARLKHRPGLASRDPRVRFFACVAAPAGHPVGPIFGLIRSDVLRRTPLLGTYISHDLPLLAELVLHGRFVQLPEVAQYRRFHPEQGSAKHRTRGSREGWFDPARAGERTFPRLRLLREHFQAVRRAAQDPRSRAWCYVGAMAWFVTEVAVIRPAKAVARTPYLRVRSRLSTTRTPARSG